MASMPLDGKVRKALVIQKAALYCIFFSSIMFLMVGVPLKNYSWNPYRTIGRTQVLYRSRFWIGRRPHKEFSSIFMVLRIKRHFVA